VPWPIALSRQYRLVVTNIERIIHKTAVVIAAGAPAATAIAAPSTTCLRYIGFPPSVGADCLVGGGKVSSAGQRV